MTLIQIAAIINLLLAFNVPVDTVRTVEAILLPKAAQTTTVAPSSPIVGGVGAPATTQVSRETPSVDLKVNRTDGPIILTSNTLVTLSWTSVGAITPGCGVTGLDGVGGNFGLNGTLDGYISSSRTAILSCNTPNGYLTDSVEILLK